MTPSTTPAFAVYKNSVTETTDGVSVVTVDYDGVTGFHAVSIDTSANPSFYAAGEDYDVVFTAGVVDGKSLAGTTLRSFSIENRSIRANVVQVGGQTTSASAPVVFPASVANEATVATRATQSSVNLIPTTPLLSTDPRLDNLDFAISTVHAAILNLNNLSAKINVFAPSLLEIPESGSMVYAFTVIVKDDEDKLVNLDAVPTVVATNAAGTNRSANLSAVTSPATGRYTFTYTVNTSHPTESLRIAISGTVSAEQRYVEWVGAVVNYDSLTTLQSIQTTVNSLNTRLPANPAAVSDIPTVIQFWSALTTYAWPNDSFGAQVVIGSSPQREIAITGSHHVAAVLHSSEVDSITDTAFTAAAVARLQANLALQSTVLVIDKCTRLIPALL